VSDGTQTVAWHCWSMARRVGMQIAELPIDVREMAFAGAERCFRAAGRDLGVVGPELDSIVDLQMRAIRQIVTDMDESQRGVTNQSAHDLPARLQTGPGGHVSKRLSAPYRSGPSRDWIKVKNLDKPCDGEGARS
jgi:hypothetical protein